MIDISDIIKMKVNTIRKQRDLLNHVGDLEDRVDDIKLRIYKMKIELGHIVDTEPSKPSPLSNPYSNRVHKAELKHNVRSSEGLSERLLASLSSHNG